MKVKVVKSIMYVMITYKDNLLFVFLLISKYYGSIQY